MIKRLLIIGLLLTLAAGFSFGAAESEGTTSDGPLTITMRPWTARGTTLQPDSAVELYLEQRYDVQLEPWYGIDSYDTEGRDVRLAAGDVPDYLGGFASGWVDIGIVRELPRELIASTCPATWCGRTNTSATRCGGGPPSTVSTTPCPRRCRWHRPARPWAFAATGCGRSGWTRRRSRARTSLPGRTASPR